MCVRSSKEADTLYNVIVVVLLSSINTITVCIVLVYIYIIIPIHLLDFYSKSLPIVTLKGYVYPWGIHFVTD